MKLDVDSGPKKNSRFNRFGLEMFKFLQLCHKLKLKFIEFMTFTNRSQRLFSQKKSYHIEFILQGFSKVKSQFYL